MSIIKPLRPYIPKILQKPIGAGDALAAVLHPVAVVLGKTDCEGCAKDQAKLNEWKRNINPLADNGPTS